MTCSVLDFFTIGIGPSSSHTVGPMRAAAIFAKQAEAIDGLARVRCDLYGSLAATGKGHGTDRAILLGWMGETPDSVDVDRIDDRLQQVLDATSITLPGGHTLHCVPGDDLNFHRLEPLPRHPNGMHFSAHDQRDRVLYEAIAYSLGGGFILWDEEWEGSAAGKDDKALAHPFDTADALVELCHRHDLSIAEIALANERAFRPEAETRARLAAIVAAMDACIDRGCRREGVLPGGLKVPRRAAQLFRELEAGEFADDDPLRALDWLNLYALAVNEENAAGGRVVTAPTNGAAGIIPAVLRYARQFRRSPHPDAADRFLLTAGAIASLYKRNASISGADVGCQGEVGVACSMAAGALVDYLGGTPDEVECAAEIGMEHNLGLTCDPVGGLVQIPCIERNAMASVKAVNAARLAMRSDGRHVVSLDKVIRTMRDTGRDMMEKYKETSRGGLAVNVTEC